MRSTRIGQNKLKKCMKLTASGLLLAVMFVLVFAGTLSGAFGIENSLQQNGIVGNNVASADAAINSSTITLSSYFNPTVTTLNITNNVSNYYASRGKLYTTSNSNCDNAVGTWSNTSWYMGGGGDHSGKDYAHCWFDFDLGDFYTFSDSATISVKIGSVSRSNMDGFIVAINSSSTEFAQYSTSNGEKAYDNDVKKNDNCDKTSENPSNGASITHTVKGRYVRIYLVTYDSWHAFNYGYGQLKLTNVSIILTRTLKTYSVTYDKNASDSTGTVSNTSHKFMAASNISSNFYVGNRQYFTEWNTSADGNGIHMGIGASTGTSVAANTFGNVVKANLAAGNTTTTLYAQYTGISFVFNRQNYSIYNNEVLQVLQGKSGYLTSTVDSSYTTTITYKDSSNSTISEPTSIGVYSATITVTKDGKTRGSVTLPFEIIEGDFGKLDGASGKWGSLSNPYVIKNATHLKNLSRIVNSDTPGTQTALNSIVGSDGGAVTADKVVAVDNKFANCYFVISADIGSASAPVSLTPIGNNASNYFAGTIYGGSLNNVNARNLRTIYLNIQQSGVNNVGLFGYASGANISYIKIAGSIFGGAYTGGVVGYADGVAISHVVNEAFVRGTSVASNSEISASGVFVGGIAGFTHGSAPVSYCYNSGYVSALTESGNYLSNSNFVGGIVGYARTEVSYCANIYDSSITFDSSEARSARIEGNDYLGGIVGNSSSTIKYCYDVQGQRKYRYNTGRIGAITGSGGTVENSWVVNESTAETTASNPNAVVSTLGKKLVTSFAVTPIVINSGETEVTWTDILSQNINGFKISTSVASGYYLKLSNNNGNGVLPYKVGNGYTAQNSTSSTAITQGNISCDVYYNATTSNDIYVQVEAINPNTDSKTYNANAQQIGSFALPTGYETLATFYFDRDDNGNPTGTPLLSKTNAGTYAVISDVKIKVGNVTYVVGRKQANWTITPLYLRVSNATFNYGVNVEKQLQNNIVISATSGGTALTSHPFSVVIDSSAYNFYKSITSGQNTFAITSDKITVKSGDNIVTGNFVISGFEVVIKESDFGVENSGINGNNIDNNKWGSRNNPYIIRTFIQLDKLSSIVRNGGAVNSIKTGLYEYVTATDKTYAGAYFKLAVSLSAGNITPIGTNTAVFSGFFDGNNKTLSGININKAGSYVGLFGYTSGATIQNLTISGAVKGSKYVGGVVGYALNTTIYNVTNNATVTARYSVDKDLSTSIRQYDGGNQTNEGFDKVFDGKTSTKFCGTQSGMSFVADLRSRLAISGFAITNANDTESNSNRRPKKIQIWGSNTENNWPSDSPNDKGNAGAWPALYNYKNWNLVFSLDTSNFSSRNYERVEFAFDGNKTYKYRYYWVYIISAGGSIQFSEFDFLAAGEDVGGVVGYASGTSGNGTVISNVKNNASVTGSNYTGGLVGRASGNFAIIDSSNAGGIMGFDGVAGVLGAMTNNANVTITSCHNSGTVSSSPESNGVAGIIGHTESASNRLVVQGCKNNAAITGDRNVGGIGGRIETTRNAKDSLVFANCYNDGSIAATTYGTVGGIAGYFFANGTSIADVATISYCFSSGAVSSNSTASDKNIGGIVGNPRASTLTSTRVYNCYTTNTTYAISGTANATIDNTNYVIASGASAPSTTNGGKYLVYNSALTFKPAIIEDGSETPFDSWTVIAEYVNATVNGEVVRLFNDINGFMVSGDVAPSSSQYFLSRKGVSSSEYLTPSKVENGNPTNAADRSNSDTFTVTAWYGANTNSDIYCSREQIKIDNSTDNVYNGNVRGFERADVNPPLASGKVYGVVFDYSNANVTPIESFICAFGADGNKIANSTNPYQVGTYDTTVFIKIGDVIVGKKCGVVYEITQETINIEWEWTDGNQSTLFSRIGTGDGIQFVYNKAEQGLGSVTFGYNTNLFYTAAEYMFTSSGNLKYTNASSNAYSRTYTLNDTRNFKIHSTNTDADLSGTTVTFEWIIRRNKLTIENRWVRADFGKDSTIYTFEYNAAHQGLLATDGITYIVENDTTGKSHEIYSWVLYIDNHANTINVGKYTRSIYVNDQTNYVIAYTNSYVGNGTAKLSGNKGVSVNDTQSSVTYSWQILAYNILDNFNSDSSKTKVWFGANTDVIVGNQLTSVISGTIRGGNSVSVDYYPLQYAQSGVQQVLVYGQNTTEVQHYLPENFIIYVRYNDGMIAQLGSNEYTLSDLEAPTAANPTPISTSVTASGQGNFAGDLSKYYTVLYSDFGWKSGKNPNSANWGTADNPYVIDRPEYLLRLSQIVNGKDKAWNSIANTAYCYAPQSTATAQNATYKGAHFLVTANIDMSDYVSTDGLTNFLPVGDGSANGERPFSATFDGGNNEIKYIYNIGYFVNKANPSGEEKYDYVGLFGYIDGATIKNLTVTSERSISFTLGDVTYKGGVNGRDYVGGIVGKAVDSTLEEVVLRYGDCVYGNDYVGGVVGFAKNTTIANSEKIFNASVSGRFYVGGIAGEWQVYDKSQLGLNNQQSLTPIDSSSVSGAKYVGGLVGWLDLSNCSGSVTFTPQYDNGTSKTLEVKGTEYVGALFGTLVGNGYRQTANSTGLTSIVIESSKVGNVTLKPVTYSDGNSTYMPKVVGGLVGFIESAALVFGTSWNTSNIKFEFDKTSTSFLGGVVGVMSKNSTIEMFVLTKNDGSQLTAVDGKITANTQFGHVGSPSSSNYNAGSFVGGIVGYVSSQAGSFWREGTTVFGNAVQFENTANIYATGFVGGIFGALGNIALSKIEQSIGAVYDEISVAQNQENRNNILQKILVGGVREGLSGSTLGIAPTTDSDYVSGANGKLRNTASVQVTKSNGIGGEYVGGIVGYSGANVRLVLRNKPQTGDINISALNVYSGGANVAIAGSYAGGIAGFTDNLEHELQYIVVQVKFTDSNATRAGGLIGEMMSGSIDGCVVVSAMVAGESISFDTDNFQGKEYVGGLVGRTENASIRNSLATGFNLQSTSITKGGVLGGGTNPTIEASWTFYIAREGATYSTISANEYGKYILVDKDTITSNGSSYPSFEKLCAFAGIANTATEGAVGVLEFALNVPTQRQLAFYDASGSDSVTTNGGESGDFESINGVLTIKLDMETGTSMQVCLIPIEFVNVPKHYANDDERISIVEGRYKKPSDSSRYIVQVQDAHFDVGVTNQVDRIQALVYFDWNNDGHATLVGESDTASEKTGDYNASFQPGDDPASPLTISNQKEWNDFAYSIYSGANDYAGKYVKLLTDDIVIDNSAHYGTASKISVLDFGTTTTNNGAGAYATSNIGYNFAGSITDANIGGQSFQGYFDGNGNSIKIKYNSGNYHNISVFPNAKNAEFQNLTITGSIVAGDSSSESIKKWDDTVIGIGTYYRKYEYNAASDIAGFVGKPLGKIVFKNCTNTTDIVGYSRIAGFAGYSTDSAPIEFIGCVNKGDIESFEGSKWTKVTGQDLGYPNDYEYGTGGLVAYATNNIVIESCLNTGKIKGKTKVGGLVGRVTAVASINNSANTGEIEATEFNMFVDSDKKKPANAWSRVGGLVGEAGQTSTLKMYACFNTGHIRGWSNIAGGLVGIIGSIPDNEKSHSAVADNVSTIAYCYNTGAVEIGNVAWEGITMVGTSGKNLNGTCGGGLVGVAVQLKITYSYNTGDVTGYGGCGSSGAWQVRNGGIIAEAVSSPKSGNHTIYVGNCYSTGKIYIKENQKYSETHYSADIVGFMDKESSKVVVEKCYGIANNIVSRKDNADSYLSGWNNQDGNGTAGKVRTGTTLNSCSDLTAIMQKDGTVKPKAYSGTNEQILWNPSIKTIGAQDSTDYNNGTLGGYIYVYGCLPQLAVFAVDTYNGLSMNSQNFGKDETYGEDGTYTAQAAGERLSPYVIRDGIDLLGVQTLVGLGYSFKGEYIEFANGKNNITLDQNLSSDIAKEIKLPTKVSQTAKVNVADGAYKAKSDLGEENYTHTGKSYHLFAQSAVCSGDNNADVNAAYVNWLSENYYYNGDNGKYANNATYSVQNMFPIGKSNRPFRGSLSGKQNDGSNTIISNLHISAHANSGDTYAGLFGRTEDAYIGFVEIGGASKVCAYSSGGNQIASSGAVVGYAAGSTEVEHCAVNGTTSIGAYGKNKGEIVAADKTVFAGGIVGIADPKRGASYSAGITAIIRNCNVSTTGNIESAKDYIGGVLGYVDGLSNAEGKGNSVRIENCNVQNAVIQAADSATTSSYIGGVLGFGSQYVSAFVTGCSVGVGGKVAIKGEHSLGGIAGGMSNAQGGYIDSCTVGGGTSITRIDQGGDKQVAESANHGTAIGGLVGFTQNSADTVSPLTTTFSGTSSFGGTITVGIAATNQSQDSDAAISCIGGIVGDMGSGANFASGSVVTVGGTISIPLAAANVGGVAGRTNTATFIGKFDVSPNMSTSHTENVGGFIGKNIGTVYILADNTDKLVNGLKGTQISIGGTIVGTSEVGGFIGVNNAQSTLNIGSNVANAKPYKSGTLNITISAKVIGSGENVGENVGGIVGKNEGASSLGATDYATIDIVKGVILQKGDIEGQKYVGGIIGLNQGLLTTGGGEADTAIGGATLSTEQINSIKNLSITNEGNVKGGALNGTTYENGDYVGGVIGLLDSPSALQATDEGKGAIAGTFTNKGTVEGGRFVGGSIGLVGKNVTITAKDTDTLFVNSGEVTAHGYFAGGSIGALVGTIEGVSTDYMINFENEGNVNATGFVGGSIGVLAGPVKFAQFVNKSNGLTVNAVNSVGGSVGYIGLPSMLKTVLDTLGITISSDYVQIVNTHFEAKGNLTVNANQTAIDEAKGNASDSSTGWGGVGGAIGVIGANVAKWGSDDKERNTYYANGNVEASGINNVGGIVGLVNADNVTISNMLAHGTTVKGGANVGGIVGATTGAGTVIKSAYAVEGTFEGSEMVGGIIGLSESDTDAKSSYWVKGYPNATLAGTDVGKLQTDLGKFETIVEYVGSQPVVFTEEFCTMYTPKTYYDDYTGTHKYDGKTITAVTDANMTWEQYFASSLGISNAEEKNGAWVKPIAGAKSYTTGASDTGWYFVYATDTTIGTITDTTIGTISAEHSVNANESYWKRIADAYTASEREAGDDTKELEKSAIVLGDNGQPQKSTLYATATSAGENSGYYLYMATSGNSRPSATYSSGKFFIKTLTASEDSLAQNVAVYYRTISRGKTLTYNGYDRFAPVGITASEGDEVPFIKEPSTDTTKADSYCYSSDMSADSIKAEPGTFKSKVKIYYFDSEGTPHVVGGVEIDWEIKKRDLEASLSVPSGTLTYGDPDIDAVLTIENIAPIDGNNLGIAGNIRFEIVIKDEDGKEIAKFTWNGTEFVGQSADGKVVSNNITVSNGGFGIGSNLSGDDLLFNVEDIDTLDLATRTFSCSINFKDAKTYKISVVTPNMDDKYNPSPIVEDQTITVNPATLTLRRTSAPSHDFDNTYANKGATWTVSGFKFNDGEAQFAAFEPEFVMALGKINETKTVTKTAMQKDGALINPVKIDSLIQVNLRVNEEQTGKILSFDLTGVSKVGDYYIKIAGGKGYRVGNYTLTFEGTSEPTYSINENKITISGTTNGTHQYDGSTKGTITVTFTADKNIVNLGQFVEQFFAASINNGVTVKTKPSASSSSKAVTWVFETGVNANKYTVTLKKGDGYEEAAKSCSHMPSALPTYSYEITKRPLTVEFAQTGSSPYEYNTYHQGLSTVKISNLCQIGSVWDHVDITLYVGDNQYVVSSNRNNAVDVKNLVSTINVGTYTATISASLGGKSSGNYYISNYDESTSWTIKKHKLTLSGLKQDDGKIYDGTPVTPVLKVNGSDISNGEITYGADTIKIKYSATVDGATTDTIVNAGTYKIGIGGNATDAIIAMRGSENTTQNYEIDGTDEAEYTIQPRQIKLTWKNAPSFVFSNAAQGLIVTGVEGIDGNGSLAIVNGSSTIDGVNIKGYAGNDVIEITISGAATHVADGKKFMTAVISKVTGTNADGSDSILKNYEIVDGITSGEFEITPSVVSVSFTATNATLEKVYDGNNRVTAQILDSYFKLEATGHVPTKFPFTIGGTYDDENVLYDSSNNVIRGKAVTFSYTFADPTNVGDYALGSVDTAAYNVGKITPKHIQVFLDKLRSNKATRTYTDGTTYGGSGVSGNGTTKPYRAGEGFRVSGVLTGDAVTVFANYAESENLRNTSTNGGFDFAKYVNDVYKDSDGTFKKATSGTYLKKLVFEMNGADAGNYTFNVYHSSDGAYSDTDGNFATKVTVYDSRESDQNRKNKSGSPQIQIEITVKSVKVEYSNTAQSYANDDNTYNTDWARVTGTNKETDKAGADIIVTNGWMYDDGKDRPIDSTDKKREYHGYTVIQGRVGNSRLGASVSTTNGMNLNYRLSNQPTLTIAYFVSAESNEYKITSLARLLIASFYYTAHQNPQNLDMIKIVSSGYAWVKVVSVGEDGAYVGDYKKPDNSPIKDSTATTWDEYLAQLQAADYAVFFDTEKNEWGYYSSNESTQNDIPLKFVQTKDITGTFTAQDIEILNAFFTTSSVDDNGVVTQKQYNWNGNNKDFLTNVLKARVGANVTIDGSLFVSTVTSKVNGSDVLTGFDGTYDGNGYVIEYLNIMGYGKTNVGLFDVIGESGIVKNVHLRNVTINANRGNVGAIAGSVYESKTTETSVKNVSVHGAINVSGGTVGGLFGTSARDIENAIVLGTITSQNANVGGVVGTTSASVKNVVSLVQITANGGSVNPFTTSSATIEDSYHMTNAVWQKGSGFDNVSGKSKTFNELMSGSISGYGTQNKYYYTGTTAPNKGEFDVLDDVHITELSAIGEPSEENPRQSMRLKDIVSVYLMMYSLSKTTGTLTSDGKSFGVNVYSLSSSSWLVGTADGTQSNPIAIANKQNVSLLRQLPFATFTLKTNIALDVASTFAGAFFGTVTSLADSTGNSLGYKITCDKDMFEAYAESNPSWIEVA